MKWLIIGLVIIMAEMGWNPVDERERWQAISSPWYIVLPRAMGDISMQTNCSQPLRPLAYEERKNNPIYYMIPGTSMTIEIHSMEELEEVLRKVRTRKFIPHVSLYDKLTISHPILAHPELYPLNNHSLVLEETIIDKKIEIETLQSI